MASKQEYQTISNIKQTQDGLDFIEFLNKLSKQNYVEWKKNTAEKSEVHKGIGIALDNLIKLFDDCDDINKQVGYKDSTYIF